MQLDLSNRQLQKDQRAEKRRQRSSTQQPDNARCLRRYDIHQQEKGDRQVIDTNVHIPISAHPISCAPLLSSISEISLIRKESQT